MEAAKPRSRRDDHTEATRQALLAAGRDAFARDGYQPAGIDACLEPAYGRIVVRKASAVLGPAGYHEIEEAHPMPLLRATLAAPRRLGELDFPDLDLLGVYRRAAP